VPLLDHLLQVGGVTVTQFLDGGNTDLLEDRPVPGTDTPELVEITFVDLVTTLVGHAHEASLLLEVSTCGVYVEHRDQAGGDEPLVDGGVGAADTDSFSSAPHLGGGVDQHLESRRIEERHPIEVNDQEGLPGLHPVVDSGAERRRGEPGRVANVDGRDLGAVRRKDPDLCGGSSAGSATWVCPRTAGPRLESRDVRGPIYDLEVHSGMVRLDLSEGSGPVGVVRMSQENVEYVASVLHHAHRIPSSGRPSGHMRSNTDDMGDRPHLDKGDTSTGIAIRSWPEWSDIFTADAPRTITGCARA